MTAPFSISGKTFAHLSCCTSASGLMAGLTPASMRNFERRRGVMAWNFDLASQDTKVIKHGYKISWPQTLKLGLNAE